MKLRQGETVLGSIVIEALDMPWWQGRFEPTDAFDSVRPIFDELSRVVATGDPDAMGLAFSNMRDLGLVIDRDDQDGPIEKFILYIDERGVRLRY